MSLQSTEELSTHMEANSERDNAVANVPMIATVVSVSETDSSQQIGRRT